MNKPNSSSNQAIAFRPPLAHALHALGPRSTKIRTTSKKLQIDEAEGVISPGIKHESTSHLKFSDFGSLVKQTPFQTYSTLVSSSTIDPNGFSMMLSPVDTVPDDNNGQSNKILDNDDKRKENPNIHGLITKDKKNMKTV